MVNNLDGLCVKVLFLGLTKPIIAKVKKSDFFELLRSLKETRRLSSESEALVKPFLGNQFEVDLTFIESSTTFASRLGSEFNDGKTVVAVMKNEDLECSILFPKSKNQWISGLKSGDPFQVICKVLEFDNLYQRAVFGYGEILASNDEDLLENSQNITQIPNLEAEDPEVTEDSGEEFIDEDLTENSTQLDITKVKMEPTIPVGENEPSSNERKSEDLPNQSEKFKEQKINKSNPDVTLASDLKDKVDSSEARIQKEELDNQAGPSNSFPPTPPPLPKTENIDKHDAQYLSELRDKRYEYGEESLTSEEKKALAEDIKKNSANRVKELEKNKEKVNKGARVFFGFILILFSLNSFGKSGGFFSFIVFCFGVFLIFPFMKKLYEMKE